MATATSVLIHLAQTFSCRIATAPFSILEDRSASRRIDSLVLPQREVRCRGFIRNRHGNKISRARHLRIGDKRKFIDDISRPEVSTLVSIQRATLFRARLIPFLPYHSPLFPHHSLSLPLRSLSLHLPIAPRKTIYSCHLATPRPTTERSRSRGPVAGIIRPVSNRLISLEKQKARFKEWPCGGGSRSWKERPACCRQ